MGRGTIKSTTVRRKDKKKEEPRHPAADVTIRVPPIPKPKSPV